MVDDSDTPNEILAEVKAMKTHGPGATTKARSWPIAKIGLAASIGSAAVAAAVLFAGRDRGGK